MNTFGGAVPFWADRSFKPDAMSRTVAMIAA